MQGLTIDQAVIYLGKELFAKGHVLSRSEQEIFF